MTDVMCVCVCVQDYGMDEQFVRSLPEAKDCPAEFMDLAFQCCKVRQHQ